MSWRYSLVTNEMSADLGLTYVDVRLSNPAERKTYEDIRAMVDTGSTLSVFPESFLERLGIPRTGHRRFRGFGGRLIRDVGTANLTYNGETGGITVVFGREDDPPILGVTALEVLGFRVDPVSEQVQRVDLLI